MLFCITNVEIEKFCKFWKITVCEYEQMFDITMGVQVRRADSKWLH